jgi:hypothetical protein
MESQYPYFFSFSFFLFSLTETQCQRNFTSTGLDKRVWFGFCLGLIWFGLV